MSQWQKVDDEETYYFIVDSKPDEIVDTSKPNTVFCTAFVDTASCINGVRESDLEWFKQYKECESLEESKEVIKKLTQLVIRDNFQYLYIWILSAKFSVIDTNGLVFIKGAEEELEDLIIKEDYVYYKKLKIKINKAKMLFWYNWCLCNMATSLVDKTLLWKKKRGIFMIDRLGDSDKRIQSFMRMIMLETSLNSLWRRCAEDHKVKPEHVGYEYMSHLNSDGKLIAAANSMQSSLVDWVVLAAYAHRNGIENRDPEFHSLLVNFIKVLVKNKQINGMHFTGEMKWK